MYTNLTTAWIRSAYIVTLAVLMLGCDSGSSATSSNAVPAESNDVPADPIVPITSRYEETDPAIFYSPGAWVAESTMGWSGGSAQYTASPGAYATFTFTGTGVSWIAYRGRYGGIARVYLDGALVTEIDTYSSTEEISVADYTVTGLTPGRHSLMVELTGRNNPSAIASEIGVDAFDVTR